MRQKSVAFYADLDANFEVVTDELVGHNTDDALCQEVAEVVPWSLMLLK